MVWGQLNQWGGCRVFKTQLPTPSNRGTIFHEAGNGLTSKKNKTPKRMQRRQSFGGSGALLSMPNYVMSTVHLRGLSRHPRLLDRKTKERNARQKI